MKELFYLALLLFLFYLFLNKDEIIQNEEAMKQSLGQKIVIDKDTLTIIDYSIFSSNYTLSNGTKISHELKKKTKTLKQN